MIALSDRPLIIGNWKMNGLRADLVKIKQIDRALTKDDHVRAVVCPPHTLIADAASTCRRIAIGGQDCHSHKCGPYTGGVSAAMLADAGARYVIIGHSERRRENLESDALVAAKAAAALHADLVPVICIGEAMRDRPITEMIRLVTNQMVASLPVDFLIGNPKTVVIAYEPIWAIGSPESPPFDHVKAMCQALRANLTSIVKKTCKDILFIYGGAVDVHNAPKILRIDVINGLLLGRPSLTAEAFLAITQVCNML